MNQLTKQQKVTLFIIIGVFSFIFIAFYVLVTSKNSDLVFLLVALIPGPIYALIIWNKYSGMVKRHKHEKETECHIENIESKDDFIKTIYKSSGKFAQKVASNSNGEAYIEILGKRKELFQDE